MKIYTISLLLFLLITISCTSSINNISYPQATASWYGSKFHGKKTASGEIYNMRKLTAAHKSLPFGTRVKIINLETNKKVIVRITDRGPFVAGRDFDLSRKAFKKISDLDKGVIKVRFKIIK